MDYYLWLVRTHEQISHQQSPHRYCAVQRTNVCAFMYTLIWCADVMLHCTALYFVFLLMFVCCVRSKPIIIESLIAALRCAWWCTRRDEAAASAATVSPMSSARPLSSLPSFPSPVSSSSVGLSSSGIDSIGCPSSPLSSCSPFSSHFLLSPLSRFAKKLKLPNNQNSQWWGDADWHAHTYAHAHAHAHEQLVQHQHQRQRKYGIIKPDSITLQYSTSSLHMYTSYTARALPRMQHTTTNVHESLFLELLLLCEKSIS